jgi:UDP-glucose 4-epimerase
MKALITGGAGFIGSHLSEELVGRGWDVVVLDDLSTGKEENLAELRAGSHPGTIQFVRGTVTDAELVTRLAADVQVVFHMAAAVGVLTIQNHTLDSIHTNLRGTECALEAALAANALFVLASTSEVYGKNASDGLTEESDRIIGSPLLSRWSYAEAKALDETITQQYFLHKGLRTIILRLFNTTGQRQSGRYGMVLPRFVRQALTNEPITVYGDGEQGRCFISVLDVIPAIVTLVETPEAQGTVFNVGANTLISINDLAARVRERAGSASEIVHVSYEDAYGQGYEDMLRRVPDCTKLNRLTGFRPATNLNAIIDSVIASERESLARVNPPVAARK